MAEITIGSDPEFIILDTHGHLVPADAFFKGCDKCNPCDECGKDQDRSKCNNCGKDCYHCNVCNTDKGHCDSCRSCKNVLYDSPVGCDGSPAVGELRPMEASTPIEHHANIKELIHSIILPKGYKLVAGTIQGGQAIGGHIHIGYDTHRYRNIDIGKLAYYLSYYCGIPLKRIERKSEIKRRGFVEDDYGYYGTYIDKEYGMEWRMPASWLVSSTIAKAALCLSDIVARDYIDEVVCGIDHDRYLRENEYHELLEAPDINNIIREIKHMGGYKKYKRQIKPIFDLIKQDHVWYVNQNLKEMW